MPQNNDEALPSRCLCATLRRAARLLNRRYEDALAPAGVTPSQFEMMAVLRRAGPSDQTQLSTLLEMDQTTLSRNLRPLQRERWVSEETPGSDRRRRMYQLTPLGLGVLAEAQRCWSSVHARMEHALGEPMIALWPSLDRILKAARGPVED